ncbi:hypothetical protein AGLY_004949 [Aphis glycines]|uniref:Uncharacterized protein n=1 Tax=Aphis glycines TaxID=307491 RepID=A0A6G0TW88_APHGL|nr:hypothetical protein AGLY_004949 [Aphis glycines]
MGCQGSGVVFRRKLALLLGNTCRLTIVLVRYNHCPKSAGRKYIRLSKHGGRSLEMGVFIEKKKIRKIKRRNNDETIKMDSEQSDNCIIKKFNTKFSISFLSNNYIKKTRNLIIGKMLYKSLKLKFLRYRVTITIYPRTMFNICYYSKSVGRYLEEFKIFVFVFFLNIDNFFGQVKILENLIKIQAL